MAYSISHSCSDSGEMTLRPLFCAVVHSCIVLSQVTGGSDGYNREYDLAVLKAHLVRIGGLLHAPT